jgi:putative ABC transport system permease protein
MYQFFGESYLISLISLFFAIILVETALPFFNKINSINIDIDYSSFYLIVLVTSIAMFSGLFAGSYPAFFLSSFKTASILKRQVGISKSNLSIRKYLVISQFTITIILLISTGTIFLQFNYLINKKNGFSIDNVIFLRLNQKLSKNFDSFKATMLQNPSINSLARVSGIPVDNYSLMNGILWEGSSEDKASSFSMNSVEPDFFKTCEFEFVEGRPFSNDLVTDSACVIINEKAKKHMGFESPLNKTMQINNDYKHKIIGVVKDFHALPLDAFSIEPAIFIINEYFYSYILLKLDEKNKTQTIEYIKNKWNEFADGFPFEYQFLDDYKKTMYGNTERTGKTFTFFVLIAILIACAGLWGLTTFTAEQKTKEIGIRKTLGASTGSILQLLSGSFVKWVLVSFIIACPIAYYFMNNWLNKFTYHQELDITIFIIAGLIILVIAQITVTYQTLKAAKANPVDCLRYE